MICDRCHEREAVPSTCTPACDHPPREALCRPCLGAELDQIKADMTGEEQRIEESRMKPPNLASSLK